MRGIFPGYDGPAVRHRMCGVFLCAGPSDDRTRGIISKRMIPLPRQRVPSPRVPAISFRSALCRPDPVGAIAMNRHDRELLMPPPFRDRAAAGRLLAQACCLCRPRRRSGAGAAARRRARGVRDRHALEAPLDIFLVRKLGLPGHEELAMGAIASGGVCTLNEDVVQSLEIPDRVIQAVAAKELLELRRRERAYRDDRPAPDVRNRTVIVVDDGLATGATMRAAVAALRQLGPQRIIVAVPTAAPSTCAQLRARPTTASAYDPRSVLRRRSLVRGLRTDVR